MGLFGAADLTTPTNDLVPLGWHFGSMSTRKHPSRRNDISFANEEVDFESHSQLKGLRLYVSDYSKILGVPKRN